jgi:hypothetical protein
VPQKANPSISITAVTSLRNRALFASIGNRGFPTQPKVFSSPPMFRAEPRMNQFTFVVLTVMGLALASYFGIAAWHASDDRVAITGTVLPGHR